MPSIHIVPSLFFLSSVVRGAVIPSHYTARLNQTTIDEFFGDLQSLNLTQVVKLTSPYINHPATSPFLMAISNASSGPALTCFLPSNGAREHSSLIRRFILRMLN